MRTDDAHGGNIDAAARETGLPRQRLLDFSASINPLGPSPSSLRALARAHPRLLSYPDPTCHDLRGALAAHYQMKPEQFVIGNGSSELIRLLPAALPIRHALIVGPTFSEYERAVRLFGGRLTRVHALRSEGYAPPVARVLAAIRCRRAGIDTIFLCNPNSPTGQAVPRPQVFEVIEAARKAGARVVIDESFVEYCEDRSVLTSVERHGHLLVLRSFTKFHALPGLRIGYVATTADRAARVARWLPPWSVNVLAQIAGQAALQDRRHARASLTFMQQERAYLSRELGRLPGCSVYPSEANFVLVEIPRRLSAHQVVASLRRRGLLIRDLSSVPGLDRRMIRVAVRSRRANRRLIASLGAVLKRGRP